MRIKRRGKNKRRKRGGGVETKRPIETEKSKNQTER